MKTFQEGRESVADGPAYPYFSKVIEKGLRILRLVQDLQPLLPI